MPVPHRGSQAAGLALVRNAVEVLTKALPQLGAETDPGQAVMKAIQSLAKHVPAGSSTPGAENAAMEQFMMQRRQLAPLLAALAAQHAGGGAPPGGPPAPAPAPQPQPSM